MRRTLLVTVAGLLAASTAPAQSSSKASKSSAKAPARSSAHRHAKRDAAPAVDPIDRGVHDVMASRSGPQGHEAHSPHLRLSPARKATAADSARARAILDNLRRVVAQYEDTTDAVKDGYRMFAPKVKNQRVYHFTKGRNARRNERGFDPERPTSLLYERGPRGKFRLVGAMYTAPRRATPAELDARVPLGIAQWHLHTNVCTPKPRQRERWKEMRGKRMVFGPAGVVATKKECDAVGGRFHAEVLNWMVHVNTSRGRDLAGAFGERH